MENTNLNIRIDKENKKRSRVEIFNDLGFKYDYSYNYIF